ncbi:DUF317 domain-containing protein [Streptomyces sp. YIM 98790]|uniref:DUF317 domain-containing protein n=1 Tax=Streptomyces sp. YIM 98790 TaxID=2689077 RepID=UPI00140B1BFD|nr:DUF317 domain-containing protein [Streptomyces sp. YIM 98790]
MNSGGPAEEPKTVLFGLTPRHLAGPGDPAVLTGRLLGDGWSNHSPAGRPQVLLLSPQETLYVSLSPVDPDPKSLWWRIGHTQQGWSAGFGARCPIEAIAAFTHALTAPPPREVPEVWHVLEDRGWTLKGTVDRYAHSADATAVISRRPQAGGQTAWTSEVCVPGAFGRQQMVWRAVVPESAPAHATAAFTATLADPSPVPRAHGAPSYAHGHVSVHHSAAGAGPEALGKLPDPPAGPNPRRRR